MRSTTALGAEASSHRAALDACYAQAASATAEGSKSFYFATRFFPAHLAKAAHAVYWFCRHTDDLVDEAPSTTIGEAQLSDWEKKLLCAWDQGTADDPILRVFVETARSYAIPLEYPMDLIEGMRMDLRGTQYETFDELRVFCYRVASVVG